MYLHLVIVTMLHALLGRINEVVRPALPASKQRLQGTAEHQLPKIDPPLIKVCGYLSIYVLT